MNGTFAFDPGPTLRWFPQVREACKPGCCKDSFSAAVPANFASGSPSFLHTTSYRARPRQPFHAGLATMKNKPVVPRYPVSGTKRLLVFSALGLQP
jgi:hypothetical protein